MENIVKKTLSMNQVCAAAASKTFDFFTNIRQAVEVLRRQ